MSPCATSCDLVIKACKFWSCNETANCLVSWSRNAFSFG